MFTAGAALLTAVQSLCPVFQSIRAEEQLSIHVGAGGGQPGDSSGLAAGFQELLNPTDPALTPPWDLRSFPSILNIQTYKQLSVQMHCC